MKDVTIKVNTIEKVNQFIDITTSFDNEDVDLILFSSRYVVDARSILGIFSLNLSNNLTLRITGYKENIEDKVIEQLKEFLV